MLETPHSVIGAAVGGLTGNPYVAVATGTASHFVMDIVPHWNPTWPFRSKLLYAFVIGDFVVALALVGVFYMLFPDRPEIAVGAFFGTVPDILLGIRYTFRLRWLRAYERFHGLLHWEVAPAYGIPPQLVMVAFSVWYLVS